MNTTSSQKQRNKILTDYTWLEYLLSYESDIKPIKRQIERTITIKDKFTTGIKILKKESRAIDNNVTKGTADDFLFELEKHEKALEALIKSMRIKIREHDNNQKYELKKISKDLIVKSNGKTDITKTLKNAINYALFRLSQNLNGVINLYSFLQKNKSELPTSLAHIHSQEGLRKRIERFQKKIPLLKFK